MGGGQGLESPEKKKIGVRLSRVSLFDPSMNILTLPGKVLKQKMILLAPGIVKFKEFLYRRGGGGVKHCIQLLITAKKET